MVSTTIRSAQELQDFIDIYRRKNDWPIIGPREMLTIEIDELSVDNCDTTRALKILNVLKPYPFKMRGTINLGFAGYNESMPEIYAIPKFTAFYKKLMIDFPYLMLFVRQMPLDEDNRFNELRTFIRMLVAGSNQVNLNNEKPLFSVEYAVLHELLIDQFKQLDCLFDEYRIRIEDQRTIRNEILTRLWYLKSDQKL